MASAETLAADSRQKEGSGLAKPASGPVTIRDIARVAGVSTAAVSKALNRKPDISAKLRDRIFAICDQLEYRVNPSIQDLARKPNGGATRNLAFVMVKKDFSDPAYCKVIDGLFKATREHDLNLILEMISGDEKHIYDLSAILRERRIDGIIVTGMLNENVVTTLQKLGVPYVILGTYSEELVRSSISVLLDMSVCMGNIVREMCKRGRTRIAYFMTDEENHFQHQMLSSFRTSLAENALDYDEARVYCPGDPLTDSSFSEIEELFMQEDLPFDSAVTPNFKLALELSHLIIARCGVGERPDVYVGVLRNSEHERIPCPAVYGETCFDRVAVEGVNVLVDLINSKTEMRPKRIVLSP